VLTHDRAGCGGSPGDWLTQTLDDRAAEELAGAPRLAGLAVFPGADHGLFVADPQPGVDRTSQLAPGFLPMLGSFLRTVG
jgi:hypothetical protein